MKSLIVPLLMLITLVIAKECSGQTLARLNPEDRDQLARCAAAAGYAGWLQRIDAQGSYVEPPADIFCVTPAPRDTWHLDAGVDYAKALSVKDARRYHSWVPSLTLLAGPIEAHTSLYYTGLRWFEHDTHFTWYQRADGARRWSLFASLNRYRWEGGSDLNGQVGARWRLR